MNLPPVIHFKKLVNVRNTFVFWDTFRLYENTQEQTLQEIYFESLRSDSFGEYKSQFRGMLKNNSNIIVHFPSNLDPQTGSTVISSLYTYPNFGGTSTVLAFDLPATE